MSALVSERSVSGMSGWLLPRVGLSEVPRKDSTGFVLATPVWVPGYRSQHCLELCRIPAATPCWFCGRVTCKHIYLFEGSGGYNVRG